MDIIVKTRKISKGYCLHTNLSTWSMSKNHQNLWNISEQESPKLIQYKCTRVTQAYTIWMYKSYPNPYNTNVQVTQTYKAQMCKSHPNLYNTNVQESPKPIQHKCTIVTQTIHYECTRVIQTYTNECTRVT